MGGDGTSYEIVNGLFPDCLAAASGGGPLASGSLANGPEQIPTLGFLPLGTGNSFLRDFSDPKAADRGLEHAMRAIKSRQLRPCDVLRLTITRGGLYYINLASVGFAADVAALRHRRFLGFGHAGYLAAIFSVWHASSAVPFRSAWKTQGGFRLARRCLFLTFNNSKFTGGTMMIAPDARTDDGLIEYVRWGPIGRLGLIRNLPTLYDGTHTRHPLAERQSAQRVEFDLNGPVDVMVDGEVMELECHSIEVLPSALRVMV